MIKVETVNVTAKEGYVLLSDVWSAWLPTFDATMKYISERAEEMADIEFILDEYSHNAHSKLELSTPIQYLL